MYILPNNVFSAAGTKHTSFIHYLDEDNFNPDTGGGGDAEPHS